LYFGDMSLDAFDRHGTGSEPWPSFQKARDLVANAFAFKRGTRFVVQELNPRFGSGSS
jgi:hypothetical protein